MMNCSHPVVPNDEALLRYVLDEEPLLPEVLEHITQCSLCQARVLRYQQLNTYLVKKFYRSRCPSATTLHTYCATLLNDEDTRQVEAHVQICPLCAREVREIEQALADFEPFPSAPVEK